MCSAGALRRVGVHGCNVYVCVQPVLFDVLVYTIAVCNVYVCVQPVLFDVLVYTVAVCNVYVCVQPLLFDVLVYTVAMCMCVFSRCSSTCWCTRLLCVMCMCVFGCALRRVGVHGCSV